MDNSKDTVTLKREDVEKIKSLLSHCLNDVEGNEINMSNYGSDEVSQINNAYVLMFSVMEDVIKTLQSALGKDEG